MANIYWVNIFHPDIHTQQLKTTLTNPIQIIIRTVLSNVAGITVDRLPKYTTIVEMLLDMKALAYKQIAEELQVSQQLTLHSDGTSKFGQHYGSFQVSTTQSSYSLGLSEMLCGSAHCTLDTLKLILSEIDVVGSEGSGNTILAIIKNTMFDRHIVEKSFKELLESYRSEVLPSIVEGWSDLSHDEQAKKSKTKCFNTRFGSNDLVYKQQNSKLAEIKD